MPPDGITVIKWSWRHHVLGAEFFESIEDAVVSAEVASDNGDESLHCIEVIEDGVSRTLTDDEYAAIADPRRQAEDAMYDAIPKSVAVVRLVGPGVKESAVVAGYATMLAAEKRAANLREIVDPERVKVEPVR